MNELSSDSEFFARHGFGNTIGFGLRPALIVIDMINGFTDSAYPLASNLDDEVESSKTVLETARSTGIPVVYTTVQYDTVSEGFAGVWQLKQKGLSSLVTGTHAVAIDSRLKPLKDESVIAKKYASAFFGTDLSSWLVSRSIDTVILVGCTTSGCVRATAVDALQHGFRPVVVKQAVGDRSRLAHDQAIFDLHQKYADVADVSEVVEYLMGRKSSS
jgi:maleamate amidohydrolase